MIVFALYTNLLNQEVFIVICTKKYCELKKILVVFVEYVHSKCDEGHLCELLPNRLKVIAKTFNLKTILYFFFIFIFFY